MNNYACINVPANLIKELKRLKKEKAITTISEFATKSIKKSIQDIDNQNAKIADNTSLENFKQAAVMYLDNVGSSKLEKFLAKICKYTTRLDIVNPTVNNFLDVVYNNAIDIIDTFDYSALFGNSITLNYEVANTLATMRVALTYGFGAGDSRYKVEIETLRILGRL